MFPHQCKCESENGICTTKQISFTGHAAYERQFLLNTYTYLMKRQQVISNTNGNVTMNRQFTLTETV